MFIKVTKNPNIKRIIRLYTKMTGVQVNFGPD